MEPHRSAQEVLRCNQCEVHAPPYYCDICQINLCRTCVGEHLLDETKEHRVLPIKQRTSTPNYPTCRKHSTKQCELHCERCDISICVHCVSSGDHLGHTVVDILRNFGRVKEKVRNDLQELEETIYPKYKDIAFNISVQKAELGENTQRLTTEISERGEDWHREIDSILMKLKYDVNQIEFKQLTLLNEQEDNITHNIFEVTRGILDLRKLLNSNDLCLISEYKSRIAEFKRFPPKQKVLLPRFSFQKINTKDLSQQFGFLSALSVTTEEDIPVYTLGPTRVKSSPSDLPLLEVPRILTAIDTGYTLLNSVACLNDEAIWTHGKNKIMKLYNLHGKLLKCVSGRVIRHSSDKEWIFNIY